MYPDFINNIDNRKLKKIEKKISKTLWAIIL